MKKNIIALCLLLLKLSHDVAAKQGKVPLYIGYTPSHQELVDNWFKRYLTDPDIELKEFKWEQLCELARFYEKGWRETVAKKFDLFITATLDNWEKIFIYSDVDVITFGPFAQRAIECLGDRDVVFQQEIPFGNLPCTGFIVARANERTLRLWLLGKQIITAGQYPGDQLTITHILKNKIFPDLKWGFLPWKEFYGPGMHLVNCTWEPGTDLPAPIETLRVFHANFTVGNYNKGELLRVIRDMKKDHEKQIC